MAAASDPAEDWPVEPWLAAASDPAEDWPVEPWLAAASDLAEDAWLGGVYLGGAHMRRPLEPRTHAIAPTPPAVAAISPATSAAAIINTNMWAIVVLILGSNVAAGLPPSA